jgi:hypothetical protein
MSRSLRSEDRDDLRTPDVSEPRQPAEHRSVSVPLDRLTLRPGHHRRPVIHRGRTYRLRDSDVRALATVGTFRVVRADDLQPMRSSREARTGDLRHLREAGLIDVKTVTVNGESIAVAVLTREGKSLLEAHQDRSSGRPPQAFHAGLVKLRELAHDAQLFRAFQAEASRIEAAGGRVERVLLGYELNREYQTFLNRPQRADERDDVAAFASAQDLPIVAGHLKLPDLRIEYEAPDGSLQHRDLELVTEHYSSAQLAGKARAGFSMYRAAGARLRGGSARTGGTPADPHHLEWLG